MSLQTAVLALQRSAGNSAVARLLWRSPARALQRYVVEHKGKFYDTADPNYDPPDFRKATAFSSAWDAEYHAKEQRWYASSQTAPSAPVTPLPAPPNIGALPAPIEALPAEVVAKILGFVDPQDLLRYRQVNHAALESARRSAATVRPLPHGTPAEFVAATGGHFPAEFKKTSAAAGSDDTTMSEAFPMAWRLYHFQADPVPSPGTPRDPAYLEKLDEKGRLFFEDSPTRNRLEAGGRLFQPTKWTPQINDAWALGIIHRGLYVRLLAPPTEVQLWDTGANRPTALGRELVQLVAAGYGAVAEPGTGQPGAGGDPHAGQGLLLGPSGDRRRDARISDAGRSFDATVRPKLAALAAAYQPVQLRPARAAILNELGTLRSQRDAIVRPGGRLEKAQEARAKVERAPEDVKKAKQTLLDQVVKEQDDLIQRIGKLEADLQAGSQW